MYLFVLILSIKDQGRAVEKARGSTGSIRRGVTLEYDEANGFKFPIGDAARAMPYKIYIQCRTMPRIRAAHNWGCQATKTLPQF